ncbi:endonuclease/exonuclease/phosphatase family protein [Yoonia litorea]|uniref:Endonuclease/Exonuclease/phosphatase family protein n=1 Tax=Yoonia litorea TaxID=1123755 RepID=A0A1I6LJC6_9RHOB|nr:endonuclease/exonuclease/phosphatase family protein [Yoonia litorea]SFS03452.1 Endonuclease/Exonuclease/phosphatase family protein [Yoonia litorea]
MRIATYNVEWFNTLFDDSGALVFDDTWSSRWNVTKAMQIEALGLVFAAMNADAVMVIEAPDTSPTRNARTALTNFAEAFDLRTKAILTGFANDTQQEIALMYDPFVMEARHDPQATADVPRFDHAFPMDVDIDAKPEEIVWSKPPLEVAVTTPDGALRLIGVHAKSKAPHGAANAKEATRISIENRRKQLAQCVWLRRRVSQHLDDGDDLIVLGDFNDGPGLDEYEKLFGRSGVEIVLGEGAQKRLYDPHADLALSRRLGPTPTTARFKRKGSPFLEVLLDYIMVSPGLRAKAPEWHIWHPYNHPDCYNAPDLQKALLTASDHFPVILDIDLAN